MKILIKNQLLEALRKIYEMTRNGKRLPVHGKSKIAILAKRAIREATGENP